MNKWAKAAKARLTEIQAAEGAAADMQTIAAAVAKLPPGQLKRYLMMISLTSLQSMGW